MTVKELLAALAGASPESLVTMQVVTAGGSRTQFTPVLAVDELSREVLLYGDACVADALTDRRAAVADDWPDALFADGLDSAILGMAHVFDGDGHRDVVAYDHQACLDVFVAGGMTPEDAEEWMSFNVTGAYVGPGTPVFVDVLR